MPTVFTPQPACVGKSGDALVLESVAEFASQNCSAVARYQGLENLDHTVLCSGSQRDMDGEISKMVFSLLSQRAPDQGPLKILEVAAGVSCPFEPDEGAPWLSRALKHQLGEAVDITVSDIQTEKFQQILFLRLDNIAIGSCLATPAVDEWYEPYISRLPTFSDDTLQSSRSYNLREAQVLLDPISFSRLVKLVRERTVALDDPRLCVTMAPCIDPAMERELFGIKFCPGVNLLDLSADFGSKSIDLVFGRHLYPVLQPDLGRLKNLQSSVNSVLSGSGRGFLHFDVSPGTILVQPSELYQGSELTQAQLPDLSNYISSTSA